MSDGVGWGVTSAQRQYPEVLEPVLDPELSLKQHWNAFQRSWNVTGASCKGLTLPEGADGP